MALLGTLQVRMGLDTAAFGQQFGNFTKDLQKRAKGFEKGLSGLTNFGSLIGSASIGATLKEGITVAGDFETSINQVAAAADLGTSSIAGLQQIALDTSKAFKVFDPTQIASGMLELTKAGISPADQAAGTLAATMQLAATEGLELSFAAETLAEQLGAFKLTAKDGASIVDALAGASNSSTASVASLADGLAQCGKVASLSGLDLQQTAGTLALFSSNGLKGSDAGTSLKTMLQRLIPASKSARLTMEALGIQFTTAEGKFKSITEIADILRDKLGKLSAEQRATALQDIFGTDAIRAAAILTEQGSAGLEKFIAATKDAAAAEKLSEARTRGWTGALAGLKSALVTAAIELTRGGTLQFLTDLANKGTALITRLSALPDWAKNLGLGFAAAAVLLPPFALALSSIVTAVPAILTGLGAVVSFLAGPWGLGILAAVGIAYAFRDKLIAAWNGITTWFKEWVSNNQALLAILHTSWTNFTASLASLWTALKTGFASIASTILAAFGTDATGVLEWFKTQASASLTSVATVAVFLLNGLTGLVNWITANIPTVVTIFNTTFTTLVTFLREQWQVIRTVFETGWNLIKTWFIGTALPEFIAAIKLAWNTQDWTFLGSAISDGLRAGIEAAKPVVAAESVKMAAGVATAAANALGIRSPSRVFHEIGENVGQGFINGIRTKITEAGQAIQSLVSTGSGFTSSFMAGFTRNITGEEGQKRFDSWVDNIKQGAIGVQSAWTTAMQTVGSAIDNFVKTGKLNFSELVRSIIADLASAALKNAFNGLLQGILGITGSGGGITGASSGGGLLSGLGSIFGGLFGGLATFEGGGFTGNGSRTGGLDNRGGRLAILHPRETVVDHHAVKKSARPSRGGAVNLSVPITLMPGVSKEELAQILPLVKRDIIATIPALIGRGGRYAGAFGQ